jgi:hypothetical protein
MEKSAAIAVRPRDAARWPPLSTTRIYCTDTTNPTVIGHFSSQTELIM